MKYEFGNNKIAIICGINKDGHGVCELEELFQPFINDESNYTHKSCYMVFNDITSLDTLISSLEHCKRSMILDELRRCKND